jgi:NADH dehydrogenase [ubiquinone] 1 alpha subcomplex assembly factor 7
MSKLKKELTDKIEKQGALGLDEFMGLVNSFYYNSKDPLGVDGDFITAPEISQMFGEMIAVWCADIWNKLGSPSSINLIEFGPGRGTLMSDVLRVLGNIPGFIEAVNISLFESSALLIDKQKDLLGKYKASWYSKISDLALLSDAPVIVISNEFLDALPVKQVLKRNNHWYEKVIKYEQEKFIYDFRRLEPVLFNLVESLVAKENSIYEISPERREFVQKIGDNVAAKTGAALFVDYGYTEGFHGDSFQAVSGHKYSDPLSDPGKSDLTAHVDFGEIKTAALAQNLNVFGPVSQGQFLSDLGIKIRAKNLINNADETQKSDIISSLDRLCSRQHMGALFKSISFASSEINNCAGFRECY